MREAQNDNMVEMIKGISPGQTLCYHVGFLAQDRARQNGVREAATAAWDAYRAGLAELTQERVNAFGYRYLITGRHDRGRG